MEILRYITLGVPITAWLIHIFIIVPLLSMRTGDDKFILAVNFFMIAGLAMIICLLVSTIILLKNTNGRNVVPVLLNLTWLYYVKVIIFGPTFGNL